MEEQLQIYGEARNHLYEKELTLLTDWKISPRNKELITKFHNYLFSTGTKEIRVAKLSSQLRRIGSRLNKDFDCTTKQDIQDTIAAYNRDNELSDATKADYRRTIKQFYLWCQENDERTNSNNEKLRFEAVDFYKYIKKISVAYKLQRADPSTIIKDDEINLVVSKGCKTYKEKALIKFLHETGVRAGELLNLRIKDVVIKENYARVIVDGKTGMREIPIVSSLPYITAWLEMHPFRDNENAYVWLGENTKQMWQPLKHIGAQKLIARCFERVGLITKEYAKVTLENGRKKTKLLSKTVKRKHNLHWFRHSRASLLAPYLTEALLCKYMGWTLGSEQVRRYVHLCNQQLDDAYLKIKGMKQNIEQQEKIKQCSCGAPNDSIARYCYKCGRPLSVAIAIQDEEIIKDETNKTFQLLMEISQNPELMEAFKKFKEQLKKEKK